MITLKSRQLAGVTGIALAMGMSGMAGAASISRIEINDFGFGLNQPANSTETQNPQINLDIVMGTFQGGPGFDGSGNADKGAGIVGFDWQFYGPVSVYTIPDKLNGPNSPQFGIYSAPSGDITGTTMALDLRAWTWAWNGGQYHQGGSTDGNMTISNLTDLGGGQYAFRADWSALFEGGPINNTTGNWYIEGTASVVPLPAAVWLMGSGLLGLIGLARRRRA